MALIEVAFVLWVLNCIVVSALAWPFGWTIAALIVAGGWSTLICVGVIGDVFSRRTDIMGMRASDVAFRAVYCLGYMALGLIAILAFPLALAGAYVFDRINPKVPLRTSRP